MNRLLVLGLFLLAMFAMGAVSASDDVNATDDIQVAEDETLDAGVVISTDADEDDFEVGVDTIEISIPYGTSGDLTVKINDTLAELYYDDEDYTVYVNHKNANVMSLSLPYDEDDYEEGSAEYDISLDYLTPGKTYDVDVFFKVSSTKTYSESFTITLSGGVDDEVEIDAEDSYLFNKTGNRINITTTNIPIGNLIITINDVPYNLTKTSNSQGYIDISKLEIGEYTIIARYGDDEDAEETFEVVAILWPETLACGSSAYVSLNLPNKANGNMTVTIDERLIGSVKVENGYAQLKIPSLTVGSHDITVQYPGEDEIGEIEGEIEVIPKITLPSKMTAGEKQYLIIDVGESTGVVYVEDDESEYAKVRFTGSTRISLSDLEDGIIGLTVRFSNDDYEFEEDYEITVYSVPIRLVAGNVKMTYTKSGTYKLKAYGTNAKPVEYDIIDIKIGKKTYEASVKNGVLSFKIPKKLAPGKYKITASYEGYSIKNTLTIKHLVSLKKVKVKKSAKKLVLKATLKKVKGKKVKFKFNGKKYVAKTNKKCIAKVTVKKSILKKLKMGKKVTYQATYLKDTVKRTVKVKK